MGDRASALPSRKVASRAVAVVVGVALAAAAAAGPRPVLASQDRTSAASRPDSAGTEASPPGRDASREPAASVETGYFEADTDGDGIPDFMDRCPGTLPGMAVDREGCVPDLSSHLLEVTGIAVAAGALLGLLLVRVFRRSLAGTPVTPPLLFGERGRRDQDDTTRPPWAEPAVPGAEAEEDRLFPAGATAERATIAAAAPRTHVAGAASAVADPEVDPGRNGLGSGPLPADPLRARSLEPARPRGAASTVKAAAAVDGGEEAALPETELVDARTVRFFRPVDRTMQLLPGRLELVEGAEPGHVIRFVRIPGVPAEVTFGRSRGAPPLHVQLLLPTVSRRHARMRYADGSWRIINHSRTNPLVLNGEVLAGDGESRALSDGDRIEMGEVAFVFRER